MIAAACLVYEGYSMYQKNIILITSIFLLFGCMDKTKLNNDGDAASIEKKSDNASPKGITFKKNADGKYEYVGRDLPFSIGKKDNDQSDLNSASNESSKNKSKLAEAFTVKWPWEKTSTILNDEQYEETAFDISEVEAETDTSTIDSETETSSEKSKSKLAEIFTVVWPWEKNKN